MHPASALLSLKVVKTPRTNGALEKAKCPSCDAARGKVIGLRSTDRIRTTHYRCGACGHAWNYTSVEPQEKTA
jgi:DNA-directed RNA polymerase subunit M/transcription elongation factor TFIIS